MNTLLKDGYSGIGADAALNLPLQALTGVSDEIAALLQKFGITTVLDLAASGLFDAARRIVDAADGRGPSRSVPGDLVDNHYRGKTASALASAPINALHGIGAAKDERLAAGLRVATIRELAQWPPFRNASAILQEAYGINARIAGDPERPDDLIPIPRLYATERVQYDVIVLDQVVPESGVDSSEAVTHTHALPTPSASALQDIVSAGGIDISDVVASALTARLAVGAVLTYRQSWYPQGLALGQLLHSMALAPGESTRIAMVDWTRRVRARADDDTIQSELLAADLARTRAMSEVTSAVAHEAQSGFSGSTSTASERQSGETSGQAHVGIGGGLRTPGLLESIGTAILGGEGASAQIGLGSTSSGTSSANSTATTTATGWASSSGDRNLNAEMQQNINDRTHQAANSVRNRRATTITETSQQESEKLSTRVVTNYNHMHALTIQYFEVVQVYRVLVELSRVTRCLFLPMKLVTFTHATIRRYRNVIARAGLIAGVRALAWAEADNFVITAPGKAGPWNASWLNIAARALGDEIGSPDDPSVVIPKAGFELHTLGGDLQTLFSELIVEYRDGSSRRFPIPESKVGDVWGWQGFSIGGFGTPGTGLNQEKVDRFLRFTLRRRAGQESAAGVAQIHLLYDIRLADGSRLASRPDIDAPTLVLPVPIRYQKDEPLTVAFEFDVTLAQADIVDHLNQNALHYSTAIWQSLDAATITTMLSAYSLGKRPLIEQIDPIPVAVSGNYLIFRSYADNDDKAWQGFLKKHQLLQPAPKEDMVPLPSGGVFAEAVLGRSNAAEKLDITRFWNWQDSPIPILPPEINPLSAGGKANDPTLRTGALEGQVLNIVNPAALPDPTGLAPLYSAMANGNMFRDMSGMAQIASLAQSALQAAQSGAAGATGAAGQAQQVAATQLTEFMKLIAQVASGALGGAGGGAAAALAGSAKPGIASTPTNAGALINQGRSMDQRRATDTLPPGTTRTTGAGGDPADEWLTYPGSSSSGAAGVESFEQKATDEAIMGGGGVRSMLEKSVREAALGALPSGADGQSDRVAPTQIRGLSGLGNNTGDGTSTTNQLWQSSRSMLEAIADGIGSWRQSPPADLQSAVVASIREATLKAAEATTDNIPLVKGMKVGVQMSLVFADAVGQALVQVNAELDSSYRQSDFMASPGDGLSEADVEAIRRLRRWQLTSVQRGSDILAAGLEAVVSEGIRRALTWMSGAALQAAAGVATQLLNHVLNQSAMQSLLAAALCDLRNKVPVTRLSLYKELGSMVIALYVRQLDDPGLRQDLAPLARLGGSLPTDKMLLGTLASLLVEPALRRINVALRAEIAARAREIVTRLRAAGQQVLGGPAAVSGDAAGITVPRLALIEIEQGETMADAALQAEQDELVRTLGSMESHARTLANTLGRMRQHALVVQWQRTRAQDPEPDDVQGYHRLFNDYVDELRELALALERTTQGLLAEMTPAAQTAQVRQINWSLPGLRRAEPGRWTTHEYSRADRIFRELPANQ